MLRRLVKQVHWRKQGAQSVVVSHWLSGDSLSLAGLLLREEKAFIPPAGVVKEPQLASSLFLLALQLTLSGMHGSSSCWPPNSVLNEISPR